MNFTNLIELIRPTHWIKNFFVFIVPIIHFKFLNFNEFDNLLITFLCFCLFSSAGYVLNDWFDRETDTFHPQKKLRPFACGKMNFYHMTIIFGLLLVFGFINLFIHNNFIYIIFKINCISRHIYYFFWFCIALIFRFNINKLRCKCRIINYYFSSMFIFTIK